MIGTGRKNREESMFNREYLLTGSNERIRREKELASHRAEWAAIREKNLAKRAAETTEKPVEREEVSGRAHVPSAREARSTGKFEGSGAILRDWR